jgi:hypothetical protein
MRRASLAVAVWRYRFRGEPVCGQCPVAGDQVLRGAGAEGGLPGLAGGGGNVAGLGEQARHFHGPVLLARFEVAQALQVPEVRLMPISG